MRTLIHRRPIRSALPDALGPGGTVGPVLGRLAAPLTTMGWLSVLAAAIYLLARIWRWVAGGPPIDMNDVMDLGAVHQVGSLATILLPAALEFGYPGVGRRNPWLLRGTALLALSEVLVPITGFLQDWGATSLLQTSERMDLAFALGTVFGIGRAVVEAFSWWAVLRGLVVAGARPRTAVAVTMAFAWAAVWFVSLLPVFDQVWSVDDVSVRAANVVALVVNLGESAALGLVVAAILTGAFRLIRPRTGWRLAVISATGIVGSAAAMLLQVLWGPFTQPDGSSVNWLFTVTAVLNVVSAVFLFAACLAGIGRGTDERRAGRPRRRGHLVTGDRRIRMATG